VRKEERPVNPHMPLRRVLLSLVIMGALLRLFLIVAAENRLDADEATTGVMAIDIAEGKAFPFSFYGTSYNGGGAMEAYGASLLFLLFGPSATVLKMWVLLTWTASALLLAGVCRRALAPNQAITALLFFIIGTPFFLEWSVKARGGFAETVLFTAALLWVAFPPPRLHARPAIQAALLGVLSGIGLWASEMLLPMVPVAVALLLVGRGRRERAGAIVPLGIGFAVGLVPPLAYNLLRSWAHLRQSVLFSAFAGGEGGGAPLGIDHLALSFRFVFGALWPLVFLALLLAAAGLFRTRRRAWLVGLLLAHTLLYLAGYWLHGLRYLPVPPSRVLYALYPGIAILVGVGAAPAGAPRWGRVLSTAAIAAWLVSVALPVIGWASSGEPREEGSWRGSWSLAPAEDLVQQLKVEQNDLVYADYWTSWSLRFVIRSEAFRRGEAPRMRVSSTIPSRSRPPARTGAGERAAIVLHEGSALERDVRQVLSSRRIDHRRLEWRSFVLYLDIDPARIRREEGLPPAIAQADWLPPPRIADGFN